MSGVPGPDPVISVDGASKAPGLNLSHWPGHRTPKALRHDLSTGSALLFAALPAEQRVLLAAGAVAIVNNHYDTDGACALFAVRHPRAALERTERLLAAARAGDFFQLPSEAAFEVDAIVAGLADGERSPLALAGLDDLGRYPRATEHLIEHLAAILDGERTPYRELTEPALERLRADLERLGASVRDELVHLSWTIWTEPAPARAEQLPGRHALFGSTGADRVLVLSPSAGGTLARLVVSTLSWFDLVSVEPLPRPDLPGLALRLNDLEGCDPEGPLAWRAQEVTNASPELWFGRAELTPFAEHNAALAPSALEPGRIRRAVADALRETLALPT